MMPPKRGATHPPYELFMDELRRIHLPRTSVNRGMKWKGQSLRTLALLLASSSTTVFPAVPHPIVLGAENSEVLPSESVAVAVMFCPTLTALLGMKVKVPVVQLEPVHDALLAQEGLALVRS